MEDLNTKTQQFKNHFSDFGDVIKNLVKVKAAKITSGAVSGILIGVTSFLLIIFFLIFFFTGIAWWLSDLFNSAALGFLTVAAFFLLMLIMVLASAKKVIIPKIRNLIVRKFYEDGN